MTDKNELPDGGLSKSTAKRVEALAGASVSERLLALADEIDRQARECPTVDWRPNAHENARNLRALQQALTQQRGHGEAVDRDAWAEALELPEGYTVEEFLPGGWHYAWTRADGERMVSGTTWNHPALAAIAAWQYAPTTTHQPSADAVRELVRRWRECAKSAANGPMFDGASEYAVAGTYIDCADKLESLLSGGSHA